MNNKFHSIHTQLVLVFLLIGGIYIFSSGIFVGNYFEILKITKSMNRSIQSMTTIRASIEEHVRSLLKLSLQMISTENRDELNKIHFLISDEINLLKKSVTKLNEIHWKNETVKNGIFENAHSLIENEIKIENFVNKKIDLLNEKDKILDDFENKYNIFFETSKGLIDNFSDFLLKEVKRTTDKTSNEIFNFSKKFDELDSQARKVKVNQMIGDAAASFTSITENYSVMEQLGLSLAMGNYAYGSLRAAAEANNLQELDKEKKIFNKGVEEAALNISEIINSNSRSKMRQALEPFKEQINGTRTLFTLREEEISVIHSIFASLADNQKIVSNLSQNLTDLNNAISKEIAETIAHLESQIYTSIIVIALLFILFLIIFYLVNFFFIRSKISNRLAELVNATNKYSNGEFDTRVDIVGKDEFAQLSQSFNEMAASIAGYSHEMEEKVKNRTFELEKSLEELKEMQKKIIVQEKLASLGALTAGIAHEIKNPLNFINNFSILSEQYSDELKELLNKYTHFFSPNDLKKIKELLDYLKENLITVVNQGNRADNIIKRMLEHSREHENVMVLTDINALLNEYVSICYHGARAQDPSFNLLIEKDFDLSAEKIKVDPIDLSRVFLNLFNNSFYALNEKKKIAGNDFIPTLLIKTKSEKGKLNIVIRDNGIGIPENLLTRLFTPFFTTKKSGEGTGLGLSISHDIIFQVHHGSIEINTKEGEFTEIIIVLPYEQTYSR